jgi:hypothetical protein
MSNPEKGLGVLLMRVLTAAQGVQPIGHGRLQPWESGSSSFCVDLIYIGIKSTQKGKIIAKQQVDKNWR